MRILCLHGRGSNNDIFRMQTGGFRSLLDDYEFDFVQGQMPHIEGNWSLHTKEFSADKLWGYFNQLDPEDVVRTERELLQLAIEDGPYDGILGYSQGATLAAQAIIRYQRENPSAGLEEMPFRFAIFFNCATPSEVFVPQEPLTPLLDVDFEDPLAAEFLHTMKANPLLKNLNLNGSTNPRSVLDSLKSLNPSAIPSLAKKVGLPLYPATFPSGRQALTNGSLAMRKADPELDGVLIHKMATLHVRCLGDFTEYGESMYRLCDPDLAQQYFHKHKHDFPRGFSEMREIARLIRSTAERA